MNALFVFIGGGLGSVLRYFIGLLLLRSNLAFPIATLISNFVACLFFAVTLYYLQDEGKPQPLLKLLLLTGFCGGMSTFSTFGYESFLLLKQGNYLWLTINIITSLGLCVGSFILIKR